MALSMKNTLISLTLTGLMLFTGFLAGKQPIGDTSFAVSQEQYASKQALINVEHSKKAKRAFTTPYFSFKKSSITVRVR